MACDGGSERAQLGVLSSPRPRRRLPAALVVLIGAALLTSCVSAASLDVTAPSATDVPEPTVTSDPAAGTADVALGSVVTISVRDGALKAVHITSPAGELQGATSADASTWKSTDNVRPSTAYQVQAVITDVAGNTLVRHWAFTTAAPAEVFSAKLSPTDSQVVGVGMPVIVKLSKAIPAEARADFVKHLSVSSTPVVKGAWRWFSDKELHWRPAEYWPAGTKVTAKAAIGGYDAGDGAWGTADVTVSYSIGDAHASTVDTAAHTMTVTSNGAVVKTLPVSTGNAKYPTRSGIHVVNERTQKVIMDSATVGIPRDSPDGYYETVFWNVRISNSGEYVHAAPWSVGSQGRANVSHGCVNASDADAQWFFGFSQIGDVVEVLNSPVQLEPTNGIGDWQIPWAQWAN